GPARHPARPDHEVGRDAVGTRPGGDEQPREVLGAVRPVGVHLDDGVVVALERPPEAVEVGAPEPLLAGPVQHVQARVGRRCLLGPLTGAVGRGVVDDEHADVGDALAQRGERGGQRLPLVVRRDDDERPHRRTRLTVRGAVATPARNASAVSSVKTTTGASPRRSLTVISVRSGTEAAKWSAVNSSVELSSTPFGAMTPLTPTVEIWMVARPCSTARKRDIASCCSDSAV